MLEQAAQGELEAPIRARQAVRVEPVGLAAEGGAQPVEAAQQVLASLPASGGPMG